MKKILPVFICVVLLTACGKGSDGKYTAVKPRYHHSWTPNHTHKKKWHLGRIHFKFEKQGVKTVKMK